MMQFLDSILGTCSEFGIVLSASLYLLKEGGGRGLLAFMYKLSIGEVAKAPRAVQIPQ